MNELLVKRVVRRLENLPDQQGYQVLDYVEFLESKYGTGTRTATPGERLSDAVHDTMRVARLPAVAIRGTMTAVDSAARLMERLAQAGKAAVRELGKSLEGARAEAPPSEATGDRHGASTQEGHAGRSA